MAAGISDLLGAGKLGKKLADLAGRFVEGALLPTQIRRIAVAEAEAKIVHAKADVEVKRIHSEAEYAQDDLRRTGKRLTAQEVRRQLNMEKIVLEAARQPVLTVSPEPVSDDWAATFFESCQDFTDQDMQALWGKLLAGEVANPGAVSKRLLNAVRLMSSKDATDFQALCSEVFSSHPYTGKPAAIFFCGDASMNVSFGGVGIETLELLQLIKQEGHYVQSLSRTKDRYEIEFFGKKAVLTRVPDLPHSPHEPGRSCVIRELTQTGRELFQLVCPSMPQALNREVIEEFSARGVSAVLS